jgi:hypothetical protein
LLSSFWCLKRCDWLKFCATLSAQAKRSCLCDSGWLPSVYLFSPASVAAQHVRFLFTPAAKIGFLTALAPGLRCLTGWLQGLFRVKVLLQKVFLSQYWIVWACLSALSALFAVSYVSESNERFAQFGCWLEMTSFTTDQTKGPLFPSQGLWCVLGEPLWDCWLLAATASQYAESFVRSVLRVALGPNFFGLILLSNLKLGNKTSVGLFLVSIPSVGWFPSPCVMFPAC